MKKPSARFTPWEDRITITGGEDEPYHIEEIVPVVSDKGVYDEQIRQYPYLTVEDVRAGRTGGGENPKLSVSDVMLCCGVILGYLVLMVLIDIAERLLK